MALSQRILDLLDVVEWPPEISVDYLRDSYEQPDSWLRSSSEEERADSRAIRLVVRSLMSSKVGARLEPRLDALSELGQEIPAALVDGRLDEYFTVELLASVAGVVRRWKTLGPLLVVSLPSRQVNAYMREATTCYLHGLFNAAAVLARAVLEFALKEKVGALGGAIPTGKGMRFIDNATRMLRLPHPLAVKVRHVWRVGGTAVHEAKVTEDDTFRQIRETAEVLSHLYGTRRQR
jgi:hypothetical protein